MKAIETPVLRYAPGDGFYRSDENNDISLCRGALLNFFELGKHRAISMRLADTPSRGSTAVQLCHITGADCYMGYRVVGWHDDWRALVGKTDRWLSRNVPALARLKKSKAKPSRCVTLHVTLYIHESE